MPTTVPIIFSLAPIPTGQSLDANQYGQMLVANLQASITANFLTGQTGGPQPSINIGPWFNGSEWWSWNALQNQYFPLVSASQYNSVINAVPMVWQRNNLFPLISNSQSLYTADRWIASSSLITGTANVSQQVISLPGTEQYPNTKLGMRITVVTPQTTIGASEGFNITQRVELGMSRPLFDKVSSLSLVLQSSVIGTYCVSLRNSDSSWSYVVECNITAAGIPQYFTFPSIPAFPIQTGDWGTLETDEAYSISVNATCGSGFQDLPNIWNSFTQNATPNQTNLFDTAGNTLDITLVQHEPGPISNPFLFVPFDQELRRCQRYYSKSHPLGVFPIQFALVTTGTTSLSGNVLTFASTTSPGISAVGIGMFIIATNIPTGTAVTAVSPTTVTISPVTTGIISIGASITFSSGVSVIDEYAFTCYSQTLAWGTARFPVKMRTTPTLNVWSIVRGQLNTVLNQANVINVGSLTFPTLGSSGFDLVETAALFSSPPNVVRFQYTANAEL